MTNLRRRGIGAPVNVVLAAFFAIASAGAAQAGQVMYVDASAPAGGDGQSWATAYRYLQDALTAAGTTVGVEFRVAQGTYRPDQGGGKTLLDPAASFELPAGASLIGGFPGRSSSSPDTGDSEEYPTILTGELKAKDAPTYAPTQAHSRILIRVEHSPPVLIEGLTVIGAENGAISCGMGTNATIRDCQLRRNVVALRTGGTNLNASNCIISDSLENPDDYRYLPIGILDLRASNVDLTDCRIEENNVLDTTALYCSEGTLSLTRCVFRRNRSDNGTIVVVNAATQINQCLLAENIVEYSSALKITGATSVSIRDTEFKGNPGSFQGAGLQLASIQQAELTGCRFEENVAGAGAAVYAGNSTTLFSGCQFVKNNANRTLQAYLVGGGAVFCSGGSATFRTCDFKENVTRYSGGAVRGHDANLQLIACRFLQNRATQAGGAFYLDSCKASLANCIVDENSAPTGSAMSIGTDSNVPPVTILINSLFVANELGSGPIIDDSSVGLAAYNSIFWNGPQPFRNLGLISHCCVQDETPGDGQVYPGEDNIDTLTGLVRESDYHLTSSSPCVDAGVALPEMLPEFDFDGQSRNLDGLNSGSAVPDIGPYEYNPNLPTLSVVDELELVIPHGSEASQTEQVTIASSGPAANWTVSGGEEWLDVSPRTGVCQRDSVSEITLTLSLAQLQIGTYTSDLTIASPEAVNSPRRMRVIVHLVAPYHVPWTHRTIQEAMDAAPAGETVLVADGMYAIGGDCRLKNYGKAITIVSEHGPDRTIIECRGGAAFEIQAGSGIVVDGFTMSNSTAPAITCTRSNSIIRNCVFKQMLPSGISRYGTDPAILIESCSPEIVNCRLSGLFGGAIRCSQSSPRITGCDISDNVPDWREWATEAPIACYDGSHPTISHCTITGNRSYDEPGAIHCTGESSVSVSHCTITGNFSYGAAGAIALEAGPASTIIDSVLNGNDGLGAGAISSVKAPVTMINCEADWNYVREDEYVTVCAAAVNITGAKPVFENCTLDFNQDVAIRSDTGVVIRNSYLAHHAKGAVHGSSGQVELTGSTFEGNGSTSPLGGVGAVWMDTGTATIAGCLFRSNTGSDGGAIHLQGNPGELAITDSIFAGNTGTARGGAIYTNGDKFSAINSLFIGNSANSYGAAVVYGILDGTLSNCAFLENRAQSDAGGLALLRNNFKMTNCIFWGNRALRNNQGMLTGSGTNRTVSRCVIQGGLAGMLGRGTPPTSSFITTADPLFVRPGLWDDKGTTDFWDDTWTEGDYRLTFNSPCIDAGDSTALPASVALDLAGLPRFVDELSHPDTGVPASGRAVVDLGPYEYAASVVGRFVFYNNSVFDGATPGPDPADDAAIATDKTALLPGHDPTTANYINYSRGINGVIVDMSAMAADPVAADFDISLLGRSDVQWRSGPTPTSVTVRRQAGVGGSDRITLIWPDQAIPNTHWLRVRVKSNASGGHLGLATDDVFCFGLAIGETGTVRRDIATVDATDAIAIRNHNSAPGETVPIDNIFDVNRDGRVDGADELVARGHITFVFNALKLLDLTQEPW